jgi:phosphoglycolate phosphatase-like HAD superfamily hydrolase
MEDHARSLKELHPHHEFFVGIDSDGCAFDTMEIKHKECFIPNIIKYWNLQAVSKYAREAAEFVNLYSQWRGINRWPALVMVFDLLRERREVQKRQAVIPEASTIRDFLASGLPLSNPGLREFMARNNHPELAQALAWSEAVNKTIEDIVYGVPPFPYVRESLAELSQVADIMVVSATPGEALVREWREHNIAHYARIIAGQEMGSKKEHLQYAAKGKYAPDHVLMIGDAPGDLQAAKANGALFFPVNPGHEDESWERFYQEGLKRFLTGEFAGAYEESLIAEFEKFLPKTPPWKA